MTWYSVLSWQYLTASTRKNKSKHLSRITSLLYFNLPLYLVWNTLKRFSTTNDNWWISSILKPTTKVPFISGPYVQFSTCKIISNKKCKIPIIWAACLWAALVISSCWFFFVNLWSKVISANTDDIGQRGITKVTTTCNNHPVTNDSSSNHFISLWLAFEQVKEDNKLVKEQDQLPK